MLMDCIFLVLVIKFFLIMLLNLMNFRKERNVYDADRGDDAGALDNIAHDFLFLMLFSYKRKRARKYLCTAFILKFSKQIFKCIKIVSLLQFC